MASQVTPLELGGQQRVLHYRTSDLLFAERQMGHSILEATQQMSLTDLATLLIAGLRHQAPKLTVEQVCEWMDAMKMGSRSVYELWGVVNEALVASNVVPQPKVSAEADDAARPL